MADQKLTALAADANPTSDDIIYVVDDVAGTPTSKKVVLSNLTKALGLTTTDNVTFANITGDAFIIGANTLDTNEWANLDGQDQTVATTSTPTFAGVTTTGDITSTGAAIDWDVADNDSAAVSFDASGQAGILVIDSTNSSEGIVRKGLKTVASSETVADDAEITLETGVSGWVEVQAGDDEEFMKCTFTAAGVVSLIHGTTNTAITDSDTNLCVYDAGAGIAIKNRLGASKTVRYIAHYSA